MRTFHYEVIDEDRTEDLTTVSVVDANEDVQHQFSLPGIFRLDEALGVAALEDAMRTRLIAEGDANEDDDFEPMDTLEDSGEFDDDEDDDEDLDDDEEWEDDVEDGDESEE